MSKRSLLAALLMALILTFASLSAAFAAEGDSVVASGAVEALSSDSITVGGVTMAIGDDTRLAGKTDQLAVGARAVVIGVEQADGSVLAMWIAVLAAPEPEPEPEPTPTPTPDPAEPATCHPVARIIALAFDETCADVAALRDSGVGFGVIGRAYLAAAASDGQLTPDQLIEMHQAGVGWGEVMRELGLHPGGKGLGTIVSGRFKGTPDPADGDGEESPAGTKVFGGKDGVKPGKGSWQPGNGNRPGNPQGVDDAKPGNRGTPPGQSKDKPGKGPGGRP